MTTFQDRERAFEAKYVHDEDFRFRVTARRDKLFAQHAATQLALSEYDAAALVTGVLAVRDGPGHDALLVAYMTDVFTQHGRAETAAGLSASLHACADQARQQLLAHPEGG